jgi:pimeloyl-ACP methyl ester carboxylesterase
MSSDFIDPATSPKPVDQEPLLYEVTGRGDPVVLVPGALTGWLSWIAHAKRLANRHRVIRVQGRSVELVEAGKPIPETYGVLTERDALLATVDHLSLNRFDLVGWSLGGTTALAFALAHQERIRTLTLIEPAAFWVLQLTGVDTAQFADVETEDRALKGKEVTIDDLKAFLVRAGLGDTDFESHPRWPVMVRNRQALSICGAEWDYSDSLERLRALDVPMLAVKGSDTAEILSASVDAIVATVPNATLLELPGGHACHLENSDRFLEALEAHLAGNAVR